MRKLFHAILVLVISLSLPIFGFAQKDILVPYRLGEKFGLSDLKGTVKLKPQYDLVEPIGGGYFKYSNYKGGNDSGSYYSGITNVKERIESTKGVLKGTKAIINNSEHRHFTVIENALIIGSQESYVSANSNFYTLNGKRLLNENVERFKILANDAYDSPFTVGMPFITLFLEHYNRKASLLVFDVANQKFLDPLLDKVNEFTLDREESTYSYLICSYYDDNYQHHKDRIYFNDSLMRHIREPYTTPRYTSPAYEEFYGVGEGLVADPDILLEAPREMILGSEGIGSGTGYSGSDSVRNIPTAPVRKKTYLFQKVNDTVVKYGEASITLPQGQKILFGDKYSSSQRQPLIYTDGSKYGLLFSDSVQSELEYDTLRYIKQNSRYLYLMGKKTLENNKWKMGVLNESGEVLIPLMYSKVTPGILELAYNRNDDGKSEFYLKEEYNYNKSKNEPLSMYGSAFTVTQNGKVGLVDFSNKILLPIEYDSLWKNGLSFLTTLRTDDDFYVYKKDGKYGLFSLNYKNEIQFETEAIFPMIPVCRYRNYAGIKDFDLIQLATDQSLYFCYAGSDGTIYYKK